MGDVKVGIDEMNRMLAEHEEATGNHNGKPNPTKQEDRKQPRINGKIRG